MDALRSIDIRNRESIFAGALVIPLAMAPLLASVDVAFGRKEWMTFPPILVALIICGGLSLAACMFAPRYVMAAVRAGTGLLVGFAALALMAVVAELDAGSDLFREESKEALLTVAATFFVYLGLTISALCRNDARWRVGAFCAMALLVGSILWDSQYPGTFSSMTTRAAGLGVNPNSGASFTVLALLACLNWQECRLTVSTVFLMSFAGGGVFLTLSRSGLLTWFVLCGFYVWRAIQHDRAKTTLLLIVLGAAASLGAAATSDWVRDSVPMLDATTTRLEAILGDRGAMDHADDTRVHLLREYFEMALERPWLGWGNGVLIPGEECYAHNIFLHKWVQHGILAVVVTLLLMKSTYSSGVRLHNFECQALAIYLFTQGWFTHNMLDERPVLLFWAILVGRAGCHSYDLKIAALSVRKPDINVPAAPQRRTDARSHATTSAPFSSGRRERVLPTRTQNRACERLDWNSW